MKNGRCGHVQIVPMCGKSSCMPSQMQIFKILGSNLDGFLAFCGSGVRGISVTPMGTVMTDEEAWIYF